MKLDHERNICKICVQSIIFVTNEQYQCQEFSTETSKNCVLDGMWEISQRPKQCCCSLRIRKDYARACPLDQLESQRDALLQRLLALEDFRPGSISATSGRSHQPVASPATAPTGASPTSATARPFPRACRTRPHAARPHVRSPPTVNSSGCPSSCWTSISPSAGSARRRWRTPPNWSRNGQRDPERDRLRSRALSESDRHRPPQDRGL